MSSALEFLKKLDNSLAKLLASPTDTNVFDAAIKRALEASPDRLGMCWALCKAIDEAEARLKAEVDITSRLRRHLAATKEMLRGEAQGILVGMEAEGKEPKVQRPEFSASLQETAAVEGPAEPEKWPILFQKRVMKIEADRAGALARMKIGEAFEGLRLIRVRSVRFV